VIRHSRDDAFVPHSHGTYRRVFSRGGFCIGQSRTKRSAEFSEIEPYLQRAEIMPVRSRTERLFG